MADGAIFILILLAIVAIGIAVILFSMARKRKVEASLQALLARDPRWRPDTALCGRGPAQLAGRCPATPRGDRRYGLEHVITGPVEFVALGETRACWASCGIWWYETEQTSTDNEGRTSTTYSRTDVPVVAVALPVGVPTEITIGSESLFGRIGLTRGGQQVESDAFNRRFRVRGGDPALTVQLLDARLQQHLLEHYPKRSLWVAGDLAVLGGKTDRADASLYGPIRALPGVRADAVDLLSHVPAQFWRAVGLPTTTHQAPPPTGAPSSTGSRYDAPPSGPASSGHGTPPTSPAGSVHDAPPPSGPASQDVPPPLPRPGPPSPPAAAPSDPPPLPR